MSHTLATVDQFKSYLTDNVAGITTLTDASILATLESSSRAVEDFLDRSDFGTGFGPRIASNRYEGDGYRCLDLRDDFLAVTSVTVYSPPTSVGATYTLAQDTDFYLKPYSGPPYREIELHGYGAIASFPFWSRILVNGTASSWPIETLTTAITMGTVSAAATSITVSGTAVVSAGHTIHYGTEDIYVTGVSGTTLTVMRGQNGTTAAPVANGGTVALYVYPEAAVSATLAVAQRRRKSQDAGLTGDFGITQVTGTSSFRDSERSVIRAHIGTMRVYGAG